MGNDRLNPVSHDLLVTDVREAGKIARLFFIGATNFDALQCMLAITTVMQKSALPDTVFIILDERSAESLQVVLGDDRKGTPQKRFPKIPFFLFGYVFDIANPRLIGSYGTSRTPHRMPKNHIRHFKAALLSHHSPVEIAPDGTYFSKSVDRKSRYFLRASRMAQHEAAQYFLASLCMSQMQLVSRADGLERIHIDTISISPVAHALTVLHARAVGRTNAVAGIRSFNSYASSETVRFGNPHREVVLISASSSASLAKQMSGIGVPKASIVTILGDKAAHEKEQLPLALDASIDPQYLRARGLDNASRAYQGSPILVEDGEFNFHTTSPKGIVLRLPMHGPLRWLSEKKPLTVADQIKAVQPFISFRKKGADAGRLSKRPLTVDGTLLIQSESFQKTILAFLDRELLHFGRNTIVATDEKSTTAASLKEHLQSLVADKGHITVVTSDELDAHAATDGDQQRVLIISPVISSGLILEDVCRSLRLFAPNASRAFLVGAWLTPSLSRADVLEKNICMSATRESHKVYAPCRIAIGYSLASETDSSSWDFERRELRKNVNLRNDPRFARRIALLDKSGPDDIVWCPDATQPLKLSQSFAFWSDDMGRSATDHSQADVLATVATVLQNARELPIEHDQDSLRQVTYERRFLSTQNFFRYNDPLLQASLLRAAEPHELDFSDGRDESASIREYVLSMIRAPESSRAQALYEFLLALQLARLRICKDHLRAIIEASKATLGTKHAWINHLLSPKSV